MHVDHSLLECKYKMDLGHWLLAENVTLNEETFGFIYEITNTVTNKRYIGKKQCKSKLKRKPLKGKVYNSVLSLSDIQSLHATHKARFGY